jgi:trehalose-6-phosphate synthase
MFAEETAHKKFKEETALYINQLTQLLQAAQMLRSTEIQDSMTLSAKQQYLASEVTNPNY